MRKTNISYPDTGTYVCVSGHKNISFSENFAYVLNEWSYTSIFTGNFEKDWQINIIFLLSSFNIYLLTEKMELLTLLIPSYLWQTESQHSHHWLQLLYCYWPASFLICQENVPLNQKNLNIANSDTAHTKSYTF